MSKNYLRSYGEIEELFQVLLLQLEMNADEV